MTVMGSLSRGRVSCVCARVYASRRARRATCVVMLCRACACVYRASCRLCRACACACAVRRARMAIKRAGACVVRAPCDVRRVASSACVCARMLPDSVPHRLTLRRQFSARVRRRRPRRWGLYVARRRGRGIGGGGGAVTANLWCSRIVLREGEIRRRR